VRVALMKLVVLLEPSPRVSWGWLATWGSQ